MRPNPQNDGQYNNIPIDQNLDFKTTLKRITDHLSQLALKVKNLTDSGYMIKYQAQHQDQELYKRMNDKLKNYIWVGYANIDIQFPASHLDEPRHQRQSQQDRKERSKLELRDWLFKLCKKIMMPVGGLLRSGQMNIEQIKTFISQNLLKNIISLGGRSKIGVQQLQQIDQCLKMQVLPYFFLKYSATQQKYLSKRFSDSIDYKSNLFHQNDVIYKSGVKFKLSKTANYDKQIMLILNYLMKIPNKLVRPTNLNSNITNTYTNYSNNLVEQCLKDMHRILEAVNNQQNKRKLLNFDVQQPYQPLQNDEFSQFKRHKQKVMNKYMQKLKQKKQKQNKQISQSFKLAQQFADFKQEYITKQSTLVQFQRRFPEGSKQFTQKQINSDNIIFHNLQVLSFLQFWCEELQCYFFQQGYFNEHYGYCQQQNVHQIKALNEFFSLERKIIQNKAEAIKQNQYMFQNILCKQFRNNEPRYRAFEKDEIMVGQFASQMNRLSQAYVIYYLNSLIHGINRAAARFQVFRKELQNKKQIKNYSLQQIDEAIQKIKVIDVQDYVEKEKIKIPQMIFLSIDLFKCRLLGREQQILAMYKYIQKKSWEDPKSMRIISVKNIKDNLNPNAKYTRIKLIYKQLANLQIQLKVRPTQFDPNLHQFTQFLQQLIKPRYGPTSQLSRLYAQQDRLLHFFQSQSQRHLHNKREGQIQEQKKRISECCRQLENMIVQELPFICNACNYFYSDCKIAQKHAKCRKCQDNLCFGCIFHNSSLASKLKLLPVLQTIQQSTIKFHDQIPEIGAFVNIKKISKEIIHFRYLRNKNQGYLFRLSKKVSQATLPQNKAKQNAQVELIQTFTTQQEKQTFQKQNIIFSYSELNKISFQAHEIQISKYFGKDRKKQSYMLRLYDYQHSGQRNTHKQKQVIENKQDQKQNKTIDYSRQQDKRKTISDLTQAYPYAQNVNLSNNLIQQLPADVIRRWHYIKRLQIRNNQLRSIKSICQYLRDIQYLDVTHNLIQQIPAQIKNLKKLQTLNISENDIRQLPYQLQQCKNMKHLIIKRTQIQKLPVNINRFASLKSIHLSDNPKLIQLDESFFKLKGLSKLWIQCNEKLQKLPSNYEQLASLQQLQIRRSHFKRLENLQKLPMLKKLILKQNSNISQLNNINKLKNLQKLKIIQNDKVKYLPAYIFQLQKLESLEISDNQGLSELPLTIGHLSSLRKITIRNNNNVSDLPQSFGYMSKLQQCRIIKNEKIWYLPSTFGGLTSLVKMCLYDTNISHLSNSFWKLPRLEHLELINNRHLKYIMEHLQTSESRRKHQQLLWSQRKKQIQAKKQPPPISKQQQQLQQLQLQNIIQTQQRNQQNNYMASQLGQLRPIVLTQEQEPQNEQQIMQKIQVQPIQQVKQQHAVQTQQMLEQARQKQARQKQQKQRQLQQNRYFYYIQQLKTPRSLRNLIIQTTHMDHSTLYLILECLVGQKMFQNLAIFDQSDTDPKTSNHQRQYNKIIEIMNDANAKISELITKQNLQHMDKQAQRQKEKKEEVNKIQQTKSPKSARQTKQAKQGKQKQAQQERVKPKGCDKKKLYRVLKRQQLGENYKRANSNQLQIP